MDFAATAVPHSYPSPPTGQTTTSSRSIIERNDGICRPACFKCATFLKIFALEEEGGAVRIIQPRTGQCGCEMNVWSNPLVRRFNGGKVQLGFTFRHSVFAASA